MLRRDGSGRAFNQQSFVRGSYEAVGDPLTAYERNTSIDRCSLMTLASRPRNIVAIEMDRMPKPTAIVGCA